MALDRRTFLAWLAMSAAFQRLANSTLLGRERVRLNVGVTLRRPTSATPQPKRGGNAY